MNNQMPEKYMNRISLSVCRKTNERIERNIELAHEQYFEKWDSGKESISRGFDGILEVIESASKNIYVSFSSFEKKLYNSRSIARELKYAIADRKIEVKFLLAYDINFFKNTALLKLLKKYRSMIGAKIISSNCTGKEFIIADGLRYCRKDSQNVGCIRLIGGNEEVRDSLTENFNKSWGEAGDVV